MSEANYKTVVYAKAGYIARISFNRPDVHNAFNAVVIREMDDAFGRAAAEPDVRVVVLTGEGKSFCAGADLNWMREVIGFSYEQNLKESFELAELMEKIYLLPKPTIARVNGATIGGGTGFLSACDIAVASEDAKFGLSEVKIGLVPAAISPYVIRRIGESRAREYFLTGDRFDARKALDLGLVNRVVPHKDLDSAVDGLARFLFTSGPQALANCKELIQKVPGMTLEEAKAYTARMIANLRISEEGQEGMAAFLEKRKPRWVKE